METSQHNHQKTDNSSIAEKSSPAVANLPKEKIPIGSPAAVTRIPRQKGIPTVPTSGKYDQIAEFILVLIFHVLKCPGGWLQDQDSVNSLQCYH